MKKQTNSTSKTTNRIYGVTAAILAFVGSYFGSQVFIPLGGVLFLLFALLSIVFFTRKTS